MTLPGLRTVPDVQAGWEPLEDAAEALDAEARRAREALQAATVAWGGLQQGYRHHESSERVWAGLEPLTGPAEDWAAASSAARAALEDFTHAGRSLQRRRERLDEQRAGLLEDRSGALASGDDADIERVRGRIHAFNEAAVDLDRAWATAQETFASALGAVRGGTAEDLAVVGTPRLDSGAVDWAGMTSELDARFGRLDPRAIWRDLRGLTDEDLRHWLEANPDAARALAEHRLPERPAPGSAEETMARARDRGDAAQVRTAWLGLAEHERERLGLLFPAVIGNLDGIPLATRGRTHRITVAGLRDQTAASLRHHLGRRPLQAPGTVLERARWQAERERLETVLSGLDQAWDADGRPRYPEDRQATPGYSTVFVSAEGNGQIVTMRGEPSPATARAVTFVPGTHSTIASADRYNDALNAMDGHDPEGTVSIYWQGTDLPQDLVGDNITPPRQRDRRPAAGGLRRRGGPGDVPFPDPGRDHHVRGPQRRRVTAGDGGAPGPGPAGHQHRLRGAGRHRARGLLPRGHRQRARAPVPDPDQRRPDRARAAGGRRSPRRVLPRRVPRGPPDGCRPARVRARPTR